jgi:anti-sigma-K factor RskA
MTGMTHEKFDELKEAYALGALPEDEAKAMESYLADNPDRRPEMEDLYAVSNLLAYTPAEYDPPKTLRNNIMDTIQAESGEQSTRSTPNPLQRLGSYIGFQRLALGAAAIAIAALLSWNAVLQFGNDQPLTYELQGSGAAEKVKAEVVEMEEDRFVLVAENMPPMPEDQTMQIWVIRDGEPQPAGTFRPSEGLAATPVAMPIKGDETIAVTVEPAGGSEQPTSDPVLQSKT